MNSRKMYKKTINEQVDNLSAEIERCVDIARGTPVFGRSKGLSTQRYGQTCEIEQKKFSNNTKEQQKTGGGEFNENPLTPLEQTVDLIVNLNRSANPRGEDFGVDNSEGTNQSSSDDTSRPSTPPIECRQLTIYSATNQSTSENRSSPMPPSQQETENPIISRQLRKRRRNELLEEEVENHKEMLGIYREQVDKMRRVAEAVERQATEIEKLCKLIQERNKIVLPF